MNFVLQYAYNNSGGDNMANTATVNVRMNKELKEDVHNILDQLGLSPSDAVKLFYKQIELNGGLPFEVKVPHYNKETLRAINEAKSIINDPKTTVYSNTNEMWEDLDEE